MPGVKGRSGGKRVGAGRKPAPKTNAIGATLAQIVVAQAAVPVVQGAGVSQPTPATEALPTGETTPLEFLLAVMRNPAVDDKLRLEAAKTAAPFMHVKKGEGGKKEEKQDAAKKAGMGKFAAAPAPLRMVK